MKKFMRFASLFLALVLVFNLAVPAFAYKNGSGVNLVDGTPYMYSYNASYTSKQANCSMMYDYVTPRIKCTITSNISAATGTYHDYGSSSGYGSVSTSASNISNDASPVSGTVTGYSAEFFISTTRIAILSE